LRTFRSAFIHKDMLLPSRFFLILLSVFFYSCSNNEKQPTDTATTGEVNITVDESFQKLFKIQIYTFQSLHPGSTINASYLPESDALLRLMNDSCKVVVMCRDLTGEERKTFESKNLFPVSTKIAEDAIAIIANPASSLSSLTVEQVKNILLKKNKEKTEVVFDNTGSTTAKYMKDSLLKGREFSNNVFAVKSSPDVIDYVSKNKSALGFLSVNWVSDSDDPATAEILKKIKIVAIAKDSASTAFKPYQAHIKTKEYPFYRNVFMINRQTRVGLGMGFVNFVAGEKGQLIILKDGLIPAYPPQRIIKIKK